MSELFEISVEAFRAFRDQGTLVLRPLTLLYGPNQSGKSTLLRLLALIGASLRPDGVPILDLDSPSLFGASFKELGWLGNEPIATPRLTLSLPRKDDRGDRYEIHLANDQGLLVDRLKVGPRVGPGEFDVSFAGDRRSTASEVSALYEGTAGSDKDWQGRLRFQSPLPLGAPELVHERLERIRTALQPLRRQQWLRANRLVAVGEGTRPTQCCSADGSDLVSLLESKTRVLETASDWLKQSFDERIEVRPDSTGRREFVLRRDGREALPLRLAGEGVRSVLPIVLCACWAEDIGGDGPTALAVEEPESHLHPSIQIALLDRLVETASRERPVVLETHSVYMLRAVQRAVLAERIAPASIGLHWVQSREDGSAMIERIDIEEDATLRGWNPEAFEEEQRLAADIMDRRWQRRSSS